MTKDLNKGISKIEYNLLNLPQQVDILSPVAEARNAYSYSAGGVKLRVVQRYNPHYSTSPVIGSAVNTYALGVTKTTDYVGNKVFENNALKRILVDGGYIENRAYYFYIPDHLGNNRVVANQGGSSIQNTDYYPFGKPMQHSTSAGAQPYKFGGKEYDTMHGLDWYDFEARMLGTDIPVFPTADPLCEKYYSISPYVYCADNPVNNVDPDGKSIDYHADIYNVDPSSRRVYVTKTDDPYDIVLINGKNPVTLPKGQVSESYYEKIGYSVWPANPVGMGATDLGLSLFLSEIALAKASPYLGRLLTKLAGKLPITKADLLKVANELEKSGLSKAGRALKKHSDRVGSAFPKAVGNQGQINAQAEKVLHDILNNPSVTVTRRSTRSVGEVIDYKLPDGIGARFSSDGKTFIGFLEP